MVRLWKRDRLSIAAQISSTIPDTFVHSLTPLCIRRLRPGLRSGRETVKQNANSVVRSAVRPSFSTPVSDCLGQELEQFGVEHCRVAHVRGMAAVGDDDLPASL